MESKDKPDSHGLWNSVQWGTKMLLCKHSSGLKRLFSWSLYSFETFMASCPCHQRNPPAAYWLQICLAHMCTLCMHTYTYAPRVLFPQLGWATFPSTVWRDNTVIFKPFRNRTRFLPNWILSFYICVSSWKLTIDRFTLVFDPTSSVMVFFQMFPSWVAITKSTGQVGL